MIDKTSRQKLGALYTTVIRYPNTKATQMGYYSHFELLCFK